MLTINVVALFPEMFAAALRVSILGRAAEQGLVRYRVVQLREYTHDRHKTVDDYPYGGGAGEVPQPQAVFAAGGGHPAGRGAPAHRLAAVRPALRPPPAQR